MNTDLTDRIAALATEWERVARPIDVTELTHSAVVLNEVEDIGDGGKVIELDHHERPRRRWAMAFGAAAAFVAGFVIVIVVRDDGPTSPAAPGNVATVPDTAAPPASTVESITTAPPTAATTPPVDIATRLAEIDAARAQALAEFDSIGFTARHVTTQPDGTEQTDISAQVVLRNDGSSAATTDTVTWSYYDATTGVVRGAFIGFDGQPAYQELVGQSDSSVALGVPTGLTNGIVYPFPLVGSVDAVTDDVFDGRAAWRIDWEYGPVAGVSQSESIWIDVETGVTLQTRTSGFQSINDIPLTDTVTLSNLVVGAPMPDGFPGVFPDGAIVDRSGDPAQFRPSSLDEASALFDAPIVVPSAPADLVIVSTMNFGNDDGSASSSPSLIVRWYDGFLRTEFVLTSYPPSMSMPGSCSPCTDSVLEDVRRPLSNGGTFSDGGGRSYSITGSSASVRAVLDSLVELP